MSQDNHDDRIYCSSIHIELGKARGRRREAAAEDPTSVKKKSKKEVEKPEVAPELVVKPRRQFIDDGGGAKFKASFDGSKNTTLTWSKDGDVLSPSEHFKMYEADGFHFLEVLNSTIEDNGMYTVTVENSAGSDSASAELEVFEKPKLLTRSGPEWERSLQDVTVHEGEEGVELTCVSRELTRPSAKWYHNGREVFSGFHMKLRQEAQEATLIIKEIKDRDAGEFKCVMTGANAELETSCVMTVKPPEKMEPPVFVKELHDMEVEEGDKLELDVEVKGTPPVGVYWFHNNVEITHDNPHFLLASLGHVHTLTLPRATSECSGEYVCEAYNGYGDTDTFCLIDVKEVEHPEPPAFVTRPSTLTARDGDEVTFTCQVRGQPRPDVMWERDGVVIAQSQKYKITRIQDRHRLTICNADQTDAGEYICHLHSPVGDRSHAFSLQVPGSHSSRKSAAVDVLMSRLSQATATDTQSPPGRNSPEATGDAQTSPALSRRIKKQDHGSSETSPSAGSCSTLRAKHKSRISGISQTYEDRESSSDENILETNVEGLPSETNSRVGDDVSWGTKYTRHNGNVSLFSKDTTVQGRTSSSITISTERTPRVGHSLPDKDNHSNNNGISNHDRRLNSPLSSQENSPRHHLRKAAETRDRSPKATALKANMNLAETVGRNVHRNEENIRDFRSVLRTKQKTVPAQKTLTEKTNAVDFREVLSKSKSKEKLETQLERADVKGGLVGSELRNLHIERTSRNVLSKSGEFHSVLNSGRRAGNSPLTSSSGYQSGSHSHRELSFGRRGAKVNSIGLKSVSKTVGALGPIAGPESSYSDEPLLSARQIKSRRDPAYSPSSSLQFDNGFECMDTDSGNIANGNTQINEGKLSSIDTGEDIVVECEKSSIADESSVVPTQENEAESQNNTINQLLVNCDSEEMTQTGSLNEVSQVSMDHTMLLSHSDNTVVTSSCVQLTQITVTGETNRTKDSLSQDSKSHTAQNSINVTLPLPENDISGEKSTMRINPIEFSPDAHLVQTLPVLETSQLSSTQLSLLPSSSSPPQPSLQQVSLTVHVPLVNQMANTKENKDDHDDDEEDDVFGDAQSKSVSSAQISPRASERVCSLNSFGSNFTWEKSPWDSTAYEHECGQNLKSEKENKGAGSTADWHVIKRERVRFSEEILDKRTCRDESSRTKHYGVSHRGVKYPSSSSSSVLSSETSEPGKESKPEDFRKVRLKPAATKLDDKTKLKNSKFMSTSTESIFTDVKLKPVTKTEDSFKKSQLSTNPATIKAKSKSSDLSSDMTFSSWTLPRSRKGWRQDREMGTTVSSHPATSTNQTVTSSSTRHSELPHDNKSNGTVEYTKRTQQEGIPKFKEVTTKSDRPLASFEHRSTVSGKSKGIGAKFEKAINDSHGSDSVVSRSTRTRDSTAFTIKTVGQNRETVAKTGSMSEKLRKWKAADAAGTDKSGKKMLGDVGKSNSNNILMATGSSSNLDKLPDWVKQKAMNKRHSLQMDKVATLPFSSSHSSGFERRERRLVPKEDAPQTPRRFKRDKEFQYVENLSKTTDDFTGKRGVFEKVNHARADGRAATNTVGMDIRKVDVTTDQRIDEHTKLQPGTNISAGVAEGLDSQKPEWLNRKPVKNIEEKIKANAVTKAKLEDSSPSWARSPRGGKEHGKGKLVTRFDYDKENTVSNTCVPPSSTTAGILVVRATPIMVTAPSTTTEADAAVSVIKVTRQIGQGKFVSDSVKEDEGFADDETEPGDVLDENAVENDKNVSVSHIETEPQTNRFSAQVSESSATSRPVVTLTPDIPTTVVTSMAVITTSAVSNSITTVSVRTSPIPATAATSQGTTPASVVTEPNVPTVQKFTVVPPTTKAKETEIVSSAVSSSSAKSLCDWNSSEPVSNSTDAIKEQPTEITNRRSGRPAVQESSSSSHQSFVKSAANRPSWMKQKSLRHIPIYPVNDNELSPRHEPFRTSLDDSESVLSTASISSMSSDASSMTNDSGYPRSQVGLFQNEDSSQKAGEHSITGHRKTMSSVSPEKRQEKFQTEEPADFDKNDHEENSGKHADVDTELVRDNSNENINRSSNNDLSKSRDSKDPVSSKNTSAESEICQNADKIYCLSKHRRPKEDADLRSEGTQSNTQKLNGSYAEEKIHRKDIRRDDPSSANSFLNKRRQFEKSGQVSNDAGHSHVKSEGNSSAPFQDTHKQDTWRRSKKDETESLIGMNVSKHSAGGTSTEQNSDSESSNVVRHGNAERESKVNRTALKSHLSDLKDKPSRRCKETGDPHRNKHNDDTADRKLKDEEGQEAVRVKPRQRASYLHSELSEDPVSKFRSTRSKFKDRSGYSESSGDQQSSGDDENGHNRLLVKRPSDLDIDPHWKNSRSRLRDENKTWENQAGITAEKGMTSSEARPSAPSLNISSTTATTSSSASATATGPAAAQCPPTFITPLSNLSVMFGSQAVLRCQVTGNPTPDVKWLLEHTPIQPSKNTQLSYVDGIAQLILSETFTEHVGEYTCRVSNPLGTLSSHCHLTLETSNKSEGRAFEGPVSLPPRIVSLDPRVSSLTRGSPLTLTLTFVGEPPPEVKWLQGGKELTSDGHIDIVTENNTSTLTIDSVNQSHAGKMSVCLTSSLGSDQASMNICIEDVPGCPLGTPHVYDIGPNTASVSWCGPVSSGGNPITYYSIEAKTRQQKTWDVIVPRCKELSCHIFELKPSTTYQFRVRAANRHGLGPPSEPSERVMTPDPFRSPSDYESEDDFPFEPREVKINSKNKFEDLYELDKEVGKGKFGVVYRCKQKTDGTFWAAKFVKCREKDKGALRQEIEIMNKLRHPKLLLLWDAFDSPRQMILVMEYVGAGELFERVIGEDFVLTERDCVHFLRQICEGVSYMHSVHILHLDLKPENILCIAENSNRIKIIDFGLARVHNPGESAKVLFGTPEFIAPEVINYDEIGLGTDMWSIGVITYVLLSGLSPFLGDSDHETLANVTSGEFDFDDEAFDEISDSAKDFISKLLIKKKEKRMLTDQCMAHDWLCQDEVDGMRYKRLNTDRLKRFMVRRKWLKTGNAVLAVSRLLKSSSLTSFGSLSRSISNDSNLDSPSPSTTPRNPLLLRPPAEEGEEEGEEDKKDPCSLDSHSSETTLSHLQSAQDNKQFVTSWIDRNSQNDSDITSQTNSLQTLTDQEKVQEVGVDNSVMSHDDDDICHVDQNDNQVASSDGNMSLTPANNDLNQNPDVSPSLTATATLVLQNQATSSAANEMKTVESETGDASLQIPVFTKTMTNCQTCAGDVARFDVTVIGQPAPQIMWYLEDEEICPDSRHSLESNLRTNSFSLIIRNIEEDDGGEYTCKAFNSQGEVLCTAELSVLEL